MATIAEFLCKKKKMNNRNVNVFTIWKVIYVARAKVAIIGIVIVFHT